MSDIKYIVEELDEIKKMLNWIIGFLKDISEKPCSSYDPLKSFMAKVNPSGMVTIPKQTREFHGIKKGDMVVLQIVEIYEKGDKNE